MGNCCGGDSTNNVKYQNGAGSNQQQDKKLINASNEKEPIVEIKEEGAAQKQKQKSEQDKEEKKKKQQEQEEEKARQLLEEKKRELQEREEVDRERKREEEEAEQVAKKLMEEQEQAAAEAERIEEDQREKEAAEREKMAEEEAQRENIQQHQKQKDNCNNNNNTIVVLSAELQKQIDEYAAAVRQIQESAFASKVLPNVRDRKCYNLCNANPSIMTVDTIVGRENGTYRENVKHVTVGSRQTHEACAEIIGSFFFAFPPEPQAITTDADRFAEGRRLNVPCSLCFFLKGAKITEFTNSKDGATHVVLLESALPSPSNENISSVELIFAGEESMLRFEIAVENAAVSGIGSLPSQKCKEAMFLKYGRSVFVTKQQ